MLALGMVIPVLPHLIEDFLGGDTAGAAKVYGVFGTVWALMQFLSMPVMGALSDRFGRRRVILLSNLGLGLDYVLMALAPNLAWLFVGRMISGIMCRQRQHRHGLHRRRHAAERRAAAFGKVGVAFGLGLRARSGARRRARQHRSAAAVLGGGGLQPRERAVRLFVLPESLPPERRRAFEWRRANPLGSLRLLRSHPELFGPRGRRVPEQSRARGAAGDVRAVRGLSLRLGRAGRSASRWRASASARRSCRADWSARRCGASANGACCSPASPAARSASSATGSRPPARCSWRRCRWSRCGGSRRRRRRAS